MNIPDHVDTRVRVETVLSDQTAQVRLLNGRIVFGYCKPRGGLPPLRAGEEVPARLFVADFSRAELHPR